MTDVDVDQVATRSYVQEVFIDPVRSVLIVDDEFPTLDALMKGYCEGGDKGIWSECKPEAKTNAPRLKGLLDYCRGSKRDWMVDVHDGKNIEFSADREVASRLRQCDLLILDYKLDGDDHQDGAKKSIGILENLAGSEHFNLVVLYSKEVTYSVFREVSNALLPPWGLLDGFARNNLEEKIEEWELVRENIFRELTAAITWDVYLRLIQSNTVNPDDRGVVGLLATFHSLYEECPGSIEINKQELFIYLLKKGEEGWGFDGKNSTQIKFEAGEKVNWIHCGNLFLTIAKKTNRNSENLQEEAADLIEGLQKALEDWNPNPNRLISSKFVSELEKRGFRPDDPAFSNLPMQALWLKELLMAGGKDRKAIVQRTVERYVDNLRAASTGPIQDFAEMLLEDWDTSEGVDAVIGKVMGVDLGDEKQDQLARAQHNRYVCSKPPDGNNLTTGHVLKIGDEFWVCLTPACDMEPRSKPKQRMKHFSPAIPFKAIKLHRPMKEKKVLEKIQMGIYLYLNIDDDPKNIDRVPQPFCFTENETGDAAPFWIEMYVVGQETFFADKKVMISRVVESTEDADEWIPKFETTEATVVTQLRYEYSINLMQKLGVNLSRVGLDFL